jgi:hypothetical protein
LGLETLNTKKKKKGEREKGREMEKAKERTFVLRKSSHQLARENIPHFAGAVQRRGNKRRAVQRDAQSGDSLAARRKERKDDG